ncbi:MAG TPA: protein translocase subunit SecF [Candidatus Magasanikbacteria bacterium]|nr:protein translocase subunit SecF [Candidatus Magasanikbacteria bacterium]
MHYNFIKNQKYFLSLSAILVASGIIAFFVWGLKPGIDFTGGALLEVEYETDRPANADVSAVVEGITEKPIIQQVGDKGLIIRTKNIDEPTHQKIVSALKGRISGDNAFTEKQFQTIGPSISAELKQKSYSAILLVLIAIVLYIAFAFRKVSRPVSAWKYGVCAVLALTHDIFIPVGIFAALGHYKGVEIDTLFVTALLTILGFSVHDTIVVFDRIRENLLKYSKESFEQVVDRSVNQTMVRSISTSFTVLLVLLAVFFFGGATIKYFVLTLILGVIFGTYSSIFVASPLLVLWQRRAAVAKR